MKIAIYLVLAIGAGLLFFSTLRKRTSGMDRNIDLIAYGIIFAGCLFLFATCISEAVRGVPLF